MASIQNRTNHGCLIRTTLAIQFLRRVSGDEHETKDKIIGVMIGKILIAMLRFANNIVMLAISKKNLQQSNWIKYSNIEFKYKKNKNTGMQ